jgi:hypothetical protein
MDAIQENIIEAITKAERIQDELALKACLGAAVLVISLKNSMTNMHSLKPSRADTRCGR